MTFKKQDVLDALGIDSGSNVVFALAGFGVGCLVGAGLALAFAPKSGRELRADLKERGRDLVSRGRAEAMRVEEAMSRESAVPPR